MQKHLINNALKQVSQSHWTPQGPTPALLIRMSTAAIPAASTKMAQQKQQEGPPPVDFGALGHMIL